MKTFLASFLGALTAFVALMAAVLGLLLGAAATFEDKPLTIAPDSVLQFDLDTLITEKPAAGGVESLVSEALSGDRRDRITLRQLLTTLDAAANDDDIQALLLSGRIEPLEYASGWGALKDVRAAIAAFRDSGKAVIAHAPSFDERTYYLASAADAIYAEPLGGFLGTVELNGFAAQRLYYKNALDRFGVEVNVVRAGDYKSAFESYERADMSDEAREANVAYLDTFVDELIEAIASARTQLTPAMLRELMDTQGLLDATQAVELGFVDGLVYESDLQAKLDTHARDASPASMDELVALTDYARLAERRAKQTGAGIAVIYAEGPIVAGDGKQDVAGERLAELLRRAGKDESVEAVVLRVNSPGGSANASEVIAQALREVRTTKPVVVSMGTVAASGGYWIATHADAILAQPTTLTGSIGVIGAVGNVRELLNNIGVTTDVAKTHPRADIGSPYRPLTDAELALVEASVDEIYTSFIERVAEGRNLPRERVEAIAQGRVWSGRDALERDLVDRLGGLDDALAVAAERANVETFHVVEYQVERPLSERIIESLEISAGPSPLASAFTEALGLLTEFGAWNDPQHVYARLPYRLVID